MFSIWESRFSNAVSDKESGLKPGVNGVRVTAQLQCSPTLALPIAVTEAEDADTVRHRVRDWCSLFINRNQLNIIDFGEEINQNWSVALCPWQLNLTAFVLLHCHPPTPHSPWVIFGALLISPLFPTNKGDAWRETSRIHMTSSRRSRPRRRYQNHQQPRRCSRLINLYLIHPTFAKYVFLCSGLERYANIQKHLILIRILCLLLYKQMHLTKCEWTGLDTWRLG